MLVPLGVMAAQESLELLVEVRILQGQLAPVRGDSPGRGFFASTILWSGLPPCRLSPHDPRGADPSSANFSPPLSTLST